jgi:hypothetical protein
MRKPSQSNNGFNLFGALGVAYTFDKANAKRRVAAPNIFETAGVLNRGGHRQPLAVFPNCGSKRAIRK